MGFELTSVAGSDDGNGRAKPDVKHATRQAGLQVLNGIRSRDDGRKARGVAIVEQLEEFLFGPGSSALSPQIVENQ